MNNENTDASLKRKHKTLSIEEKELLEAGTSVKHLCDVYNIGSSTVYDIRRKKDALLQFNSERQSEKGAVFRKTVREGERNLIENALVERFEQRKTEGVTVTGGMIIEQAKKFQNELNPSFECKYSQEWIEKYKTLHGIKLNAENEFLIPSESDAVVSIKKFTSIVKDEALHPEQIYSAHKTDIRWQHFPEDIFASENDRIHINAFVNYSDHLISVFNCFNAVGSHKCKLLVVNDKPKDKVLDGVKVLPVIYRSNEKKSITRDIMIDWIRNHFAVEARTHCAKLGFPENCKLLLILESCLAPSIEQILRIDNVIVLFVPTWHCFDVQPQVQGVERWLECWYRLECMADFLEAIIRGESAESFKKEFDLKASIWALARAWESISEISFKRSWHKLYSEFADDISETDVAKAYTDYKQQILNPIADYVKGINANLTKQIFYENLEGWIESGAAAKFYRNKSGNPIAIKEEIDDETGDETDEQNTASIEYCVGLTSELISGLEKQDCITEQELMYMYRLKAKLVAEKLKKRKYGAKGDFKSASVKKEKKF